MKSGGLFLVAFLMLAANIFAQGTGDRSTSAFDTTKVDGLIAAAAQDADLENKQATLESAVLISKKMQYRNGVVRGSELLIASQHNSGDFTGELRSLLQLLNFLQHRPADPKLPQAWFQTGHIYFQYGVYHKAADAYDSCLTTLTSRSAELHYPAMRKLAWSQQLAGDFPTARASYQKANAMATKAGNVDEMLWIFQQQAKMAHDEKQFGKELQWFQKAYRLSDSLQMGEERQRALNNIGYTYRFLKDPVKAEAYFGQVLASSSDKKETEAIIKQNLGILYQNEKEYEKSTEAFSRAANLYSELRQPRKTALLRDFLALVYYQQNDLYNAGIQNARSIELSKKHGALDVLQSCYRTKSLIHQELFEFEQALESFKTHLVLKDSLQSIERDAAAALEQEQQFVERLEKELSLLWASEELKDLELARQAAENRTLAERARTAESEQARLASEKRNALIKNALLEEQAKVAAERAKVLEEKRKVLEADLAIQELQRAKSQQELQLLRQKSDLQAAEQAEQIALLELEKESARLERLAGVVLFILLLLLLVLWGYRQVRKKNSQIASQNTIIAAERDKSDQLLLNILPASVAAELKDKGQTSPRQYESITVVFTDFAGFTKISEKLSPAELVETLDKIFLEFDLIAEANGLNRIKTIGDAYMCACGLPEPEEEHARKSVAAAIQMRNYIATFNDGLSADQPQWNVRIGVNTGPVVAGVVGIKKFAYDIWGDAVNVASRMESSGSVGKVNISESTHAIVKDHFSMEYRGKIEAKNKGQVDMYFAEANE